MTRDEVMALTDEELRINAAELVGWTSIGSQTFPSGHTLVSGAKPGTTEPIVFLPDYPHDIAAAWELVDSMVAAGHDVAINSYQSAEDHVSPFSTWCTVDENDELDSGGTTAPRAITRAFVLAMTKDKP
jgi:hypothetical protein